MPIRDILLTVVVFGSLPICFLRPWIGMLVWSWIGYMNPHRLAWGFARNIPFAFMVAMAVMFGFLFTKDRYSLPRTREVFLLLLLWGTFFLSTLFAVYPQDAWEHLNKVSKILLMTFMTLLLLQETKKVKMLLWVIALSIGFFGLKGGIWGVLTGGQNMVLGPPNSFISGNTEIGLAMNMVLPLLLFLRRETNRPWLRHVLLAIFVFSIIAILITYSRGALLGLAVVLSVLFLKGRGKVIVLLILCVGFFLAAMYLPEKWVGRMETIETYEQDRSAMGRLRAWEMAWNLALDRPFLGAGFRAFQPEMYQRYLPEYPASSRDAHSIFFQVLAEHGFTGIVLYIMLILSTFLSLRQLIRRSRRNTSLQWIFSCAQMLEASLIGYVVSGMFLSLSYFDLFYQFVAIVIILKQLTRAEERKINPKLSKHRATLVSGIFA
jgi:probable O-glycosylation ligase (exosortase A-associated)